MSGKAARRGRFFGRRRPKAIQVETPEEQRTIDPARSRKDWERWLWQIEGIYGPLDFRKSKRHSSNDNAN
jgi:hypothetical protein